MNNTKKKVALIALKYSSCLFAILYFINTILMFLGLYTSIISWISFISLLPMLILYLVSEAFEFCIWHKLPWIYVLFCNITNAIDLYFVSIAIGSVTLIINASVFGFVMILCAYLKNKYNKHVRINKK